MTTENDLVAQLAALEATVTDLQDQVTTCLGFTARRGGSISKSNVATMRWREARDCPRTMTRRMAKATNQWRRDRRDGADEPSTIDRNIFRFRNIKWLLFPSASLTSS
jgi:hypothetical protein